MLTDKSSIQKIIDVFNSKHGCNLSLDAYEAKAREYMADSPKVAYDLAYKDIFASIYRQAAVNSVINNKAFSGKNMLDEFENNIMRGYSIACKEQGENINLKPYAGMSGVERAEFLKNRLNEFPNNKLAACRELYNNGGITIEDMENYINSIGTKEIDRNKAAMMAAFASVLEEANNSRSFIWKVGHPLKNSSEQRVAELMKKALKSDRCKLSLEQSVELAKEETENMQNERVINYSYVMTEKDVERQSRYREYEKEQIEIHELAAEEPKNAKSVAEHNAPEKEPMKRL